MARAGIEVLVLEKHADFLRDFRGDTVHPSTLEVMYELGVLDDFARTCRAEQLFDQAIAAAELHLLGEDAEGGFRGDEVDAGDARVGVESRSISAAKIEPLAPVTARAMTRLRRAATRPRRTAGREVAGRWCA